MRLNKWLEDWHLNRQIKRLSAEERREITGKNRTHAKSFGEQKRFGKRNGFYRRR